jgi:hypothetical protein
MAGVVTAFTVKEIQRFDQPSGTILIQTAKNMANRKTLSVEVEQRKKPGRHWGGPRLATRLPFEHRLGIVEPRNVSGYCSGK